MTRKTFRNILWAASAAFATICIICGAYHHLVTAGLIFLLGMVQEEEQPKKKEGRYEL